ncbi:hypothetical protein HanIR_Chr07g0321631 [Helianthus annuus]|nr:hypothetical protein HanIR_Chr07g0321631 [Helianthus annuus]
MYANTYVVYASTCGYPKPSFCFMSLGMNFLLFQIVTMAVVWVLLLRAVMMTCDDDLVVI